MKCDQNHLLHEHPGEEHGVVHLRVPVAEPVRLGEGLVDGGPEHQVVVVHGGVQDALLARQVLGNLKLERLKESSSEQKEKTVLTSQPNHTASFFLMDSLVASNKTSMGWLW